MSTIGTIAKTIAITLLLSASATAETRESINLKFGPPKASIPAGFIGIPGARTSDGTIDLSMRGVASWKTKPIGINSPDPRYAFQLFSPGNKLCLKTNRLTDPSGTIEVSFEIAGLNVPRQPTRETYLVAFQEQGKQSPSARTSNSAPKGSNFGTKTVGRIALNQALESDPLAPNTVSGSFGIVPDMPVCFLVQGPSARSSTVSSSTVQKRSTRPTWGIALISASFNWKHPPKTPLPKGSVTPESKGPTSTPTATRTVSNVATPTPTIVVPEPTATKTPLPAQTPTQTPISTSTSTATPSVTPTRTPTPTNTSAVATATNTPTSTNTPANAPSAPVIESAHAATMRIVHVIFKPSNSTASALILERKTGAGGIYKELARLSPGTPSYRDVSCYAGKTYFYRAKHSNGAGDSSYSLEVSATTPGVASGAMKVVSGLTVAPQSATSATISFTETNTALSQHYYFLWRSENDGMEYHIIQSLGSSTSATDDQVSPGKTYWYAINGDSWNASESDFSTAVSVSMPSRAAGSPVEPTALSATNNSATSVTLNWTNLDPNAPPVKIERALFDQYHTMTWMQLGVTAAGATTYVDNTTAAETPYLYRVRAWNGSFNSAYAPVADEISKSMFGGRAIGVVTASLGTGSPKTYDIYNSLNDLDWTKVGPGDTVNIHSKVGGYHEIFQISTRGTAAKWITINGIPDPSTGAKPVIDGAAARLFPQFQNHYGPLSGAGLLVVGARPGYIGGFKPGYIKISGLELTNSNPDYTFTDFDGSIKSYPDGSGVYIERGDNVTLFNNVVHNDGNGIFAAGQSGFDRLMTGITLDSNYIYGNGIPGSYLQHNSYVEAIGTVYKFNHYGPVRSGSAGADLKSRDCGAEIVGNRLESGSAVNLQLPESENQIDLAATLSCYGKTIVYGNILTSSNGESPVWYGNDHYLSTIRTKGPLHFFDNTLLVRSSQSEVYRITVFRFGPETFVDAQNNIFAGLPSTAGSTPSNFGFLESSSSAYFGVNWVPPGYVASTSNDPFTGYLGGISNLFVGATNNPGFVDYLQGNLYLQSGAAPINRALPLRGPSSLFPVQLEYLDPNTSKIRLDAADLGAFNF